MTTALLLKKNPYVCQKLPFSCSELERLVAAMMREAGLCGRQVELSILDDADMEELHRRSLGCAGPTNILSFPASGGSPGPLFPASPGKERQPALLGWLALSADTLRRECYLYGQEPEEHCIRLLAHGLAHLMGFDHGPAMSALCDRLENSARLPSATAVSL